MTAVTLWSLKHRNPDTPWRVTLSAQSTTAIRRKWPQGQVARIPFSPPGSPIRKTFLSLLPR